MDWGLWIASQGYLFSLVFYHFHKVYCFYFIYECRGSASYWRFRFQQCNVKACCCCFKMLQIMTFFKTFLRMSKKCIEMDHFVLFSGGAPFARLNLLRQLIIWELVPGEDLQSSCLGILWHFSETFTFSLLMLGSWIAEPSCCGDPFLVQPLGFPRKTKIRF